MIIFWLNNWDISSLICLWMPGVNTFPNFTFLFFLAIPLTGTMFVTVIGNISYNILSEIKLLEYSLGFAVDNPRIC